MEDDIDIEEHDVLDNPKIRDIFPDLSLVKIEVPDPVESIQDEYEETQEYHPMVPYGINIKKENTSDEENNTDQYGQNDSSTSELGRVGQSHNERQNVPATSQFEQNVVDNFEFEENEMSYNFERNESTSTEFEDNGRIHFNKIILGSKRVPDYDTLYKEALHSNVSVYLEDWEDKLRNNACYCNDCEILFPTGNALDAHNSISHSFLVALDTPRPNTARKSTTVTSSRYCNHCDKMFFDDTALIKHLYELLPLDNFRKPTPEPVKIDPKSTRYKCIKCRKYFATYAAGKEHKKSHHPTLSNVNIICKVLAKPESPKLDTVKKEYPEGKFFAANNLIPKSVLFQCHVCQTNFVSCYSATQHSVRCRNTTEYHKCKTCKRKIRTKDNYIHTLQHRYAEPGAKLRIYTLQKYISEKVYLKCPKCSICFDERTFWVHYGLCTTERFNFIRCNICRIDVNQSRYPNHKSKHVVQKCTKKDFIIIKFYDVNRSSTPAIQKPIKEELEEPDEAEEPVAEDDKIPLYYCQVCGSYKTFSSPRGHKNGACKTLSVKFCELCGLGFSRENYKQHRQDHSERKLTLNDFKIINLKTGAEMEVPISNFHCCKRCKIHFLSREKMHLHDCAKEAFEFCEICNKKFNIKAFAPHSNFHTHSNFPELLKKYNSINDMWNVVYLCTVCNLVTITYDSVVEHSQNHINDVPKPLSKKCDLCEFDIIEQDYKPHMQLHTNNLKIDRAKFKVLTFHFENLYSTEWMTMFSSLPKSHKYQILSKSIYRFSRRFKFNCEINCPSEGIKIYCKRCKTEVAIEDTKKHYFDKTCNPSTSYVCKPCNLQFNTLLDCVTHEQEHDGTKNYKVITFNDQKDEVFDHRLKEFELTTEPNPSANLVSPTKSPKIPMKSFTQTKSSKSVIKGYPIKSSKLSKTICKLKTICANTVKEEVLRANRMKLYKCEKCGSCVSMMKNIPKHKCCMFGKTRLKLCHICKEYFYNRHVHLHMELHRQFPRLLKKPLVILFNPNSNTLPVANIFQCECGLHFTSRQSIDNHLEICSDGLEISKETCSKCNLLFPTDVLVTHLCKHHSKPMDIRVQLIKIKKTGPCKCADCNIIFTSMTSYDEHLFNCAAKNGRICSHCNLIFDSKTFPLHKCSMSDKIPIIKKSAYISILYRCHLCNLTYLNRKSISYHFERRHVTRRDIVTCRTCKLKFTSQSYTRHKSAHINGENYIIKIIEPATGRSSILKGKNTKVVRDRESSVRNAKIECTLNMSMASDDDFEESLEVTQEEYTPDESDVGSKKTSYRVYRCHECQTCYVLKKRLETHLQSNHVAKSDHIDCEVCGLRFQKKLMPRHMAIHSNHETEYNIEVIESDTGKMSVLKGKNFKPNVNNISNSNKRSSYFKDYSTSRSKRTRRYYDRMHNMSNENSESQNDQPSTSKFGFESVDMTEGDNDTVSSDVEKDSTIDSISVTNDPLNSTESIIPDVDVEEGNANTSSTRKLKAVTIDNISDRLKLMLDANLRNYNTTLYKCRLCSLHFLTDGSVLWHVSRNHNRSFQSYNCDICGLNFTYATLQRHVYVHHAVMKLEKESFNIQVIEENTTKIPTLVTPQSNADQESADKEEEIVPPSVGTENVVDLQNDAKIHYYKCRECNVCFLDDVTCREHCTPHTYLDPKSYIECKICNFQFLIDSLKTHVNVHHVDKFFLEHLIITEYYSTGDENLRVEVYQGIDKVQSRLVSTTTGGCDVGVVIV